MNPLRKYGIVSTRYPNSPPRYHFDYLVDTYKPEKPETVEHG
jgi:hypothetical protein